MRVADKRRKPFRRKTAALWVREAGRALARALDCPRRPWFGLSLPPKVVNGEVGQTVRTSLPTQYWRSVRNG